MGKRKPGRKYRTPALPWEKIQKTKPVTMLRAIKRLLILSHKKSIRTAMPEMAKSSISWTLTSSPLSFEL